MTPIQIKIPNQLLIPFGGPKWTIDQIRVVGVSTTGTYIQSSTPLAYIDRSKAQALRLSDFESVIPGSWKTENDSLSALKIIQAYLRDKCELATEYEKRFLNLYFEYCLESVKIPSYLQSPSLKKENLSPPYNSIDWVFEALMPLPQAHLYQHNPFQDNFEFIPDRMMKVDFAFWTGNRLVAIEIDGSSHSGSEDHIKKDRLLQRAGVDVIHILNNEIDAYGKKVISRLLPSVIQKFWKSSEKHPYNPFADPF